MPEEAVSCPPSGEDDGTADALPDAVPVAGLPDSAGDAPASGEDTAEEALLSDVLSEAVLPSEAEPEDVWPLSGVLSPVSEEAFSST